MKKIVIISIATVLFIVGVLQQVFAQSPNKLSYQAVIRNGSNALVKSQSIGMRINILQGSASGASVYVETQTPTTNTNGLASIEIGGGTVVSGNFSTINWANGPYFVKTETDPGGGTNYSISGTNQLLSVPYALYAATAGNNTPGPQGPIGATGATGPQGPSGANGANGNNGINGTAVLNGTTNPTSGIGADGDFYINTTSNTLFGPKSSGTWPAGISLIGATGPQGAIGLTGATGPQGPTGLMGATGPQGSAGAQGPNGLTGATGPQGPTGLTGAAGAMGPQGPAGLTGVTGPQGVTGQQGPIGLTGATGATGATGPQGTIGLTGATGSNGLNSLIKTTLEPASSNCSAGGIKVETGIDANSNGVLDALEIQTAQTKYVCNGFNSNSFVHYVGELFGGGIVVSLWRENGIEKGLIASLYDLCDSCKFSNVASPITTTSFPSLSLFDGIYNDSLIINQAGHTSSAALLCENYSYQGYTDWFLPSSMELKSAGYNLFVINKSLIHNGFTPFHFGYFNIPNYVYWSSTEYKSLASSSSYIYGTSFNTPDENFGLDRTSYQRVRAFRKF